MVFRHRFIAVGIALWTKSRLLISMMAVGVLILEIVWNIDFFFQLITGQQLINLTNYMFDEEVKFVFTWAFFISCFFTCNCNLAAHPMGI